MTNRVLDKFNHEISCLVVGGAQVSSFDIWSGVSYQDIQRGLFNDDEYGYLTCTFSTLSEKFLEEYKSCLSSTENIVDEQSLRDGFEQMVEKYCHSYLSHQDKNVQRAMKMDSPILYNEALVEPDMRELHRRLDQMVNEVPETVMSVLVPVSTKVESRWKGLIWIRIHKTASVSASGFIQLYRQEVLELADYLYSLWYVALGREYSMFKMRGVFCENATAVASDLVDGYAAREIAQRLSMSHSGVEYHIDSMKRALGARNRAHLIAELFRRGIVS